MLEPEELKKLKNDLPRNYVNLIIAVFNKKGKSIGRTTIHRTLSGEADRLDVIEAALKVVQDHRKKTENLKKKLS